MMPLYLPRTVFPIMQQFTTEADSLASTNDCYKSALD